MGRVDGKGQEENRKRIRCDEQCGETGSRKRAGENLAVLSWAGDGWPASFCGVEYSRPG